MGNESNADAKPSEQAVAFKNEIVSQIDEQLSQLKLIINQELPAYNKAIKEKGIDAIILKDKKEVNN